MKNSRTILVTAGPTRAYLDDIRFLTNLSTGVLGFEICRAFKRRQWNVIAIVGPTPLPFEVLSLRRLVRVETNEEMLDATMRALRQYRPEFGIFSAAVLDFIPSKQRRGKTRSSLPHWKLDLVPAPKLIGEIARKFPSLERIEFKLESKRTNPAQLGRKILKKSGSLAVCVNFLGDVSDARHKALVVTRSGQTTQIQSKIQLANTLYSLVAKTAREDRSMSHR